MATTATSRLAGLAEETAARTVTLNSVSKTFAMTGWRLGYCLGPLSLAPVLSRINHLTTRCATSYVQYAAITAYTEGMPHLENMRAAYAERRKAIAAGLERIAGVRCPLRKGHFTPSPIFPKIGEIAVHLPSTYWPKAALSSRREAHTESLAGSICASPSRPRWT